MPIEILKQITDPRLRLGIAEVDHGHVREASQALQAEAAELAAQIASPAYAVPEPRRVAVRRLLKLGGFSPTGRNKPAHEYLVNDIKERGSFNHINNVVDVNNVISLQALLPISIFDMDKLGPLLTVRLGVEGESYVFNPSGQVMDLKGCIVCCTGEEGQEPVGSPVKDSLATKVFDGATRYLGVIYISTEVCTAYEMSGYTQRFADLLARETGGYVRQSRVV